MLNNTIRKQTQINCKLFENHLDKYVNAIYLCHKYNEFPGFSYRNNDGYLCYFTRHNK